MRWEPGHRQVGEAEFSAWITAYPRPLTTRVHESPTGFILHLYLDDAIRDSRGHPRCVASVQPPDTPRHGPIYRIHGEAMQGGKAA